MATQKEKTGYWIGGFLLLISFGGIAYFAMNKNSAPVIPAGTVGSSETVTHAGLGSILGGLGFLV